MDVVKNSLCGGNRPTEIGARLSVEASAVSFELKYSDIQAIRVERPVPHMLRDCPTNRSELIQRRQIRMVRGCEKFLPAVA